MSPQARSPLATSRDFTAPERMGVSGSYDTWMGLTQRDQVGNGKFSAKISAVRTAGLEIIRAAWSPGLVYRGTILGGHTGFVIASERSRNVYYQGALLEVGSIAVMSDRNDIDYRTLSNHELLNINVNNHLLNRYLVATTHRPIGELVYDYRLWSTPDMLHVVTVPTMNALVSSLLVRSSPLEDARSSQYIEHLVLDALFGALNPPERAASNSVRRRIARVAESYLREQLTEPVSIMDLCELTGASKRTLHLAFLECFGMSPKQLLTYMRLNGARRDLWSSDGSMSVTDIAMKWGFFHLGRFSIRYREMFGEAPMEALRRRGIDPADDEARFSAQAS
jgi:AraC family ethanolamine operon transcriptional activator